jgi:hypothetical protein
LHPLHLHQAGLSGGCVETRLIVVPKAVFYVHRDLGANLQLDCSDGLWGWSGRHQAHPDVSVLN